jgi:hypothetical protein
MALESEASLTTAIAALAEDKAEHRKILHDVVADPGMTPETRLTLVEHLYAEEDEHVARIAALAAAPGPAPAAESGDAPRGFTVGSLRAEAAGAPAMLGSLRRAR